MKCFLVTAVSGVLLAGALGACNDKSDRDSKKVAESAVPPPVMVVPRSSPEAYKQARHQIDSLETKIREAVRTPEKAPDIRLTLYMIKAYQYFAADFPQDLDAPVALDRAGQLYAGVLHDYQKAVEYYQKAYEKYPSYKNRPNLLLQKGLASEAGQDTANAAQAYQILMVAYPEHPMAAQARDLLKLLRMSATERQQKFNGKRPPVDAAASAR
jgi:tetratricopeptide (TPR) repeat protein